MSLILIVASLAQVAIWLVNTPLPDAAATRASAVIVHGVVLFEEVAGDDAVRRPALFVAWLLVALMSAVAWYGATRVVLGRSWALATGLFWVAHPAFALVAQRPAPLALLIAAVPTAWWLLGWWRARMRWVAALLLGLLLGLSSLFSVLGVLLVASALLAMLVAHGPWLRKYAGIGLMLAAFCVPPAVWLTACGHSARVERSRERAVFDLWNAFAGRDGSELSRAAHEVRSGHPTDDPTPPLRFLRSQLVDSPRATTAWLARRSWRALYATSDGRLQRPLFVLQLLWLLPAAWGYIVAWRCPAWRWMAFAAGTFVAVTWLLAALAQPLARNLTPVGGFAIMFGLMGVVDVYERFFGRRLTAAQ